MPGILDPGELINLNKDHQMRVSHRPLIVFVVAALFTHGMAETPMSQKALWSEKADLTSEKVQTFLDSLKGFGDHERFAIRIARFGANDDHYAVQLWREDVRVLVSNPNGFSTYHVSIFRTSGSPVDDIVLKNLENELTRILADASGVLHL